jgi:hypothetical protein
MAQKVSISKKRTKKAGKPKPKGTAVRKKKAK